MTNQLTRDPPRTPSDAKQVNDLFESFTPYFPIAGPSFPRRDLLESTPDDEDDTTPPPPVKDSDKDERFTTPPVKSVTPDFPVAGPFLSSSIFYSS